jgi:hypothetical protein
MASGVFWRGDNGQVYVKGHKGVNAAGAWDANTEKYWTSRGFTLDNSIPAAQRQAQQVSLPTSQTVSVGGGGGGGGYVAPAPVGPTAEQIAPILASIGSLDGILNNKNAQTDAEYAKAIAGYDAADAIDKSNYTEGVVGNEKAYTSNNQKAILNAVNSYGGLRGVMASMGALAGSGKNVISRLVGLAANTDTGASRDNFDANAGALNTNWSKATQAATQRRKDAEATRDNTKQNNQASILTSRQQMLQQLSGMYDPTMAQGKKYAAEATALAAPIAATSRASVAPYAAPDAAYSPAALKTYLAGTQNLNVNTSAGGQSVTPLNSPLFGKDKKDQLPGVA